MLVPKVLIQFTRKRVLTMEWVDGENPKDLLSLSKGVSKKILKLQISRSWKQNLAFLTWYLLMI